MYKYVKTKFKHFYLEKKLKKKQKYFYFEKIDYKFKNVLIIDSVIPEYNKDSGSRRLFELINLILKNDIGVFLIANLKEYKYKSDYIQTFKDLGAVVYEPSLDKNNKLITKELFIKAIAPHIHYAWLHRPDVFKKYHKTIKALNPDCKLIYDMVDFHYLRLIREWEQNRKSKLKENAEKHLQMELNNCKYADAIIVISENDKVALKQYYSHTDKMTVMGNIHQFIKKTKEFIPFSKRNKLLFVGSFKHLPNVDAVIYLHDHIMPLVWKENPNIKVIIIGSYPTQDILNLNSDRFIIKGFVVDISDYFKKTKLFIAPLRYGAGIKGKIGQSFEFSLPVITTSIGAEGFDFSPFTEAIIANTAELLASRIIALYNNESMWSSISAHSENIISPFSIAHIESQLKNVLNI